MSRGFKAIWFTSKAWKNERIFKEEKEKYAKTLNDVIAAKDKELSQYNKKFEELNSLVQSSKTKEADFAVKLKQKERQISALELEKADILRSKKIVSGDSTAVSIRPFEERVGVIF